MTAFRRLLLRLLIFPDSPPISNPRHLLSSIIHDLQPKLRYIRCLSVVSRDIIIRPLFFHRKCPSLNQSDSAFVNHLIVLIRLPSFLFFLHWRMSLVMTPQALSPSDVAPLAPRISTRLEISTSSNSPPSSSPFAENLPEVISNGAFSKTWVLPPRKKPGRKAANDVPPTVPLTSENRG